MTNEFGLDTAYFRKKLRGVLDTLDHYTPEELARELGRLGETAKRGAVPGSTGRNTKPRCPDTPRWKGDLAGCGSTNVTEADEEGFHDCIDCGLFFKMSSNA